MAGTKLEKICVYQPPPPQNLRFKGRALSTASGALGAPRPPRRCESFFGRIYPKPWFSGVTALNGRAGKNRESRGDAAARRNDNVFHRRSVEERRGETQGCHYRKDHNNNNQQQPERWGAERENVVSRRQQMKPRGTSRPLTRQQLLPRWKG